MLNVINPFTQEILAELPIDDEQAVQSVIATFST